jgi:DNA replication protein DnaC
MELTQAKTDGSYSKALQALSKIDLLILDDWGLEPLKAPQRNDLMEIMDDRHESTSTKIISQLPTDQWYQSIGDNTLADAILDRLHNSHRIKLKGESIRKIRSKLTLLKVVRLLAPEQKRILLCISFLSEVRD